MSNGLEITLKTLAATDNEAAVDLLMTSLWARQHSVREGAIKSLLSRKGASGKIELVSRWGDLEARWKELIAEKFTRMTPALRQALESHDEALFRNACEATVYVRDYDQVPVLISAIEGGSPFAKLAEDTLVSLCSELYKELATPRQYGGGRKDPQISRRNSLSHLEDSVLRFPRHQSSGVLEGFLMLTSRENSTLKSTLQSPSSQTFNAMADLLKSSAEPGIMRLLLSFLDDPQAPTAAVQLIALRYDSAFLGHLLKKIGHHAEDAIIKNLNKVEMIPWMYQKPEVLEALTDAEQQAAMQFAHYSSMNRKEVFKVIGQMLKSGKPGGQRAAAIALGHFEGAQANQLALDLLEHSTSEIKAVIIGQLRKREIPGAMNRLMDFVESSEPEIREAAQRALEEFNFDRYLSAYDMLEDDVRRSTGQLVRKVDRHAKERLVKELHEESRSRCLRALSMAPNMGMVEEIESEILGMLHNTDHFIRTDAVKALAHSSSPESLEAIRGAATDNSVSVRTAAAEALAVRGEEPPAESLAIVAADAEED